MLAEVCQSEKYLTNTNVCQCHDTQVEVRGPSGCHSSLSSLLGQGLIHSCDAELDGLEDPGALMSPSPIPGITERTTSFDFRFVLIVFVF